MAITTETFKLNAGWSKVGIITQMEDAFTYLGWNAGYETGQVVGLSSFWGGGDTNSSDTYHQVFQKSTSGIGTGASFWVYRDTLGVRYVVINRPGVGYTSGELITIDAEDIGGFANGATDLNFKVCINETVANGATFGVSYNTIPYQFTGADRNGVVGGGQTILTIREGDTISIGNSWTNDYYLAIKNPIPYDVNSASDTQGRIAGSPNSVLVGSAGTFQPKIGQAGTYFFAPSNRNYNHEVGRMIVEPWSGDPADRTVVGIGSTIQFWDKNLGATNPWGVAKHTIQSNKRYGDTYKLFVAQDTTNIDIVTGNGWSFYQGSEYYSNTTQDAHGGTGISKRFSGAAYLDYGTYNFNGIRGTLINPDTYTNFTTVYMRTARISHGSNTGFELDLNLFKSSLDPNFVVFSYKNPTLSSTHIGNNTFGTWFFHNFTTNIWDLDYVFLGGLTEIVYQGSTTDPRIVFKTYFGPQDPDNLQGIAKRSAEFGYASYRNYSLNENNYVEYSIESKAYEHALDNSGSRIYYRSNDNSVTYSGGTSDTVGKDRVSAEANFNAAIKGLPMNGNLIPVPYYIPDDFVLINFYYNAANANIQQGDTITISPSEVYKVICGSYNQTTVTRGILFCARVV